MNQNRQILTPKLQEILNIMKKIGKPVSTTSIQKYYKREQRIELGAIRHRLERLRKLKLVQKRGKAYKCQVVLYKLSHHKWPDKHPLSSRAFYCPRMGYYKTLPRPSLINRR